MATAYVLSKMREEIPGTVVFIFQGAEETATGAKLMIEEVGDQLKVKASGGIKDRKTALEYINLGVSRIGTSSGIAIVAST